MIDETQPVGSEGGKIAGILDADKQKIQILLAEYNSLRAEMLQRYATTFQLIALGSATAALISLAASPLWKAVVAFVASLIICSAAYIIRAGIRQLSEHVRELERKVNKLAGDDLLTWEARTEFIRKKHRFPELGRDIEARKRHDPHRGP